MKRLKLLLAGEGGQGIQTIAKVISDLAAASGIQVSYIPSFGVEQRGTPSVAFLIFDSKVINYPRFDAADYAIILQERAIPAVSGYLTPNTKVIFDSSTIQHTALPKKCLKPTAIPATKYAYEQFTPRAFNIIITGHIAKILGISLNDAWAVIEKTLGKKFKTEKIKVANHQALIFGYDAVLEQKEFTKPTYTPSHETIVVKGFGKHGMIVPERCKGCGICIEKCPVGALTFSSVLGVYATPVPEVDLEKCIACGNCFRFCPDAAIVIEKDKVVKTVEPEGKDHSSVSKQN
ncbi:MAG TPA: 2-oxoacid:acceptor oxidoreductase family protein [bacterium]|nr:2-oxoacid:acceptor oxidoreductase family protein [bacterium]